MIIYGIFVLMSTGVWMQTDIPPFKTKESCETRLVEMDIKDLKCMELNVARAK